jgi:hypothetical protein
MSHVYSSASVTLVAEASPDCNGGIFASGNAGRLTPQALLPVPCLNSEGAYCGTIYPQVLNPAVGYLSSYVHGPLSSRAWALQEDVLSQRILRYSQDQLFWACRTLFHPESNPAFFDEFRTIYDPRNFRRQELSMDVNVFHGHNRHLLLFWYTILKRYRTQALTFESDKFPAISGMAREIAARGNYTYKAGIWHEDAYWGLLWSTTGTARRTSQYIAPSWSWASLIEQNGYLDEKADQVTENIAQIVHINVTNVGDDIYGQITSASLKIQSRWRSIDPWDQEQAEIPPLGLLDLFRKSHSSSKKIQIYFDLEVARDSFGQGIICIQIAKGIQFGEGNSLPPTLYALLLEPTNHGKLKNEYRRIGLAALLTHAKYYEGWEQGTFTIV